MSCIGIKVHSFRKFTVRLYTGCIIQYTVCHLYAATSLRAVGVAHSGAASPRTASGTRS